MIALPLETFSRLERSFAEAIFSDDAPIPATVAVASGRAGASRFGVYRNNVIGGLMNAVAARYPVVRKLLWEDSFSRVAHLYVTMEPPRSPVLLEYGKSFPDFLRKIGEGSAADYLADIADLEAARAKAYHAAEATPLDRSAFANFTPDQLMDLQLVLHPSVTLLRSRFPVVSAWEANLSDRNNAISEWKPECALVARPELQVEVRRLSADTYEFLVALAKGRTVASAIASAVATATSLDLADCFALLIAANIVIEVRSGNDMPIRLSS